MDIPKFKLLITLEWSLGIPDGKLKKNKLVEYTDNEIVISKRIEEMAEEHHLIENGSRGSIQCFGDEYYIHDYNGNYIASAKVETVLYGHNRAFRLGEEIEI